MKVYLAHPISGMSYSMVATYYHITGRLLSDWGIEVLSPMTGRKELRTEKKLRAHGYEDVPVSTNHAIFERDMWMVKQADVVLVDLRYSNSISIVCVMELAWAALLGKHTVVIMESFNDTHRHAFVLEAADVLFDTIIEAVHYLRELGGISGDQTA